MKRVAIRDSFSISIIEKVTLTAHEPLYFGCMGNSLFRISPIDSKVHRKQQAQKR